MSAIPNEVTDTVTAPVAAIAKDSPDYVQFCYKEYTRLAAIQESHLQSAFSDIKLLSAVGAIIAWKPVMGAFSERNDPLILMLGFIAILFVALFVFLFDFMKQSIMLFYTDQMKHYERELRRLLVLDEGTQFSIVRNWSVWMQSIHEPLATRFFLCFFAFVIGFPAAMILFIGEFQQTWPYALGYLVVALCFSALNIQSLQVVMEKTTESLSS